MSISRAASLCARSYGVLAAWSLTLPVEPCRASSEPPAPLAILKHDELRELSGLAASRVRPDVVWAVNDSGLPPVLYGIRTNGEVVARVELADAHNEDWEDLASFGRAGEGWLLVADCGDNLASRDHITLWLTPEPRPGAAGYPTSASPSLAMRVTFQDAPRDVESVAVDEPSSRVLLLSKRDSPPRLYAAELPPMPWTGQTAVAEARLVAELRTWTRPPGLVQGGITGALGAQPTAMDFDPIHRRLVVLTYTDAWLWSVPGEGWAKIESAVWRRIPLPDPREGWLRRREAVAWSRDGAAILLTTEGRDPPLVRIEPPAESTAVPSAQPMR